MGARPDGDEWITKGLRGDRLVRRMVHTYPCARWGVIDHDHG